MNTSYLTDLPLEWEPLARIFAAVGDRTRQRILLLFEPGEAITLKTIVDLFPLSRTSVVHHVNVLEDAGLLVAQKKGREVLYIANAAVLVAAMDKVREYARPHIEGTFQAGEEG